MAKVLVTEGYLSNIASAIRSKNNSVTIYHPGDMAAAIRELDTGGIYPSGTKQITENGTVDVTNYAGVNVNVQPNLQSKTVTENGTVTPDKGYDGLSSVVVNVSGGDSVLMANRGPYIDTGVPGSTSDLSVYMKFKLLDISVQAIFGARWSESGFFLMVYNGKLRFHSGGKAVDTVTVQVGEMYEIEATKAGITINGTSYALSSPSESDVSNNVWLFHVSNSLGNRANLLMYMCKMYEGDTLLRDFKPNEDANEVGCLHDMVTDVDYYAVSGSGAFIYV